jgi:crotonobetainyl-CoA:carnitine CoA-transferase CaiB-like acyl-CoA transferase
MPGYGAYETADGRWMYPLMLNDGHWAKFCHAPGLPEAADESLARLRDRKKQRDRVEALVKAAVVSMTYDKLAERLKPNGFSFAEVLPLEHVLDTPHAKVPGKLRHTGFRGYSFEVPGFPGAAQYSHDNDLPPRELGEDTLEVLQSAGVSLEQCEALLKSGAIAVDSAQDFQWAPVRTPG